MHAKKNLKIARANFNGAPWTKIIIIMFHPIKKFSNYAESIFLATNTSI
jgi:hypothetical protein